MIGCVSLTSARDIAHAANCEKRVAYRQASTLYLRARDGLSVVSEGATLVHRLSVCFSPSRLQRRRLSRYETCSTSWRGEQRYLRLILWPGVTTQRSAVCQFMIDILIDLRTHRMIPNQNHRTQLEQKTQHLPLVHRLAAPLLRPPHQAKPMAMRSPRRGPSASPRLMAATSCALR